MTLTTYKQNQELFANAVLWWQGRDETNLGFPILPAGVTVTPNGTWANDLSLGNSKTLKTFDGSGNYISLGTSSVLNLERTDTFAICYWLKGQVSGFKRVFGNMNTGPSYTGFVNSLNQSGSNIQYMFELINNTGTGNRINVYFSVNNDSNWHYVVITYTGTSLASGIKMYLDGVEKTLTVDTNALSANIVSSNTFAIGRTGALAEGYNYVGNIKELLIYKGRALTQAEITTIMRLTNPNTGMEIKPPVFPGVRGVE